MQEEKSNIRNFCIIAHIDHGKSTLADRLLEYTATVEKRKMKEQLLDTMDLERERGITIKLQPVTMHYNSVITNDQLSKINELKIPKVEFMLNLIDTPGHVDFAYEVSRSLAAVEGAILLVDSTQGVQAQTLANLYQAIEQGLEIIPVVNKIDLPNADVEKTKKEIIHILGCKEEEIIAASGKTGQGVDKILEAIVTKVPSPRGKTDCPLRAMIFDSKYDTYKGVLAFVRIVDGQVRAEDEILMMATGKESGVIEVGKFKPDLQSVDVLRTGEIGYIATGFKSVEECRVGDTITLAQGSKQVRNSKVIALPGYKEVQPMVYASFYPQDGEDYNQMRDALEKLKLNDAALTFEPESSKALGRGFRLGFLGLLHLEIVQERLKREFGFEPTITTPSVVYKIIKTDDAEVDIFSAAELPDPNFIREIREPHVKLDVVTPAKYLGDILGLITGTTRSRYLSTEYIDENRVSLTFDSPLSEVIVNLHDSIKSASSGFASMNYEVTGYEQYDLVRMDIFVAGEKIEAFSQVIPREKAFSEGKRVTTKLKEAIPRQSFQVALQAAIGGKILARDTIKPFRKDVIAKLYGGDVTRKNKLLDKQKKGKKKMQHIGRVDIPQKAFLAILKK
jgi:GTP-binding protein LepA